MKITIDKVRSFDMTRLQKLIEEGDVARLKVFMTEYGLTVKDGKIVPDKTHKHLWDESVKYWDKKQLVTKINLNSAYGSLLNAGSRFYDKRVGQSTTLSGRMIVRHMSAFINEFMTGQYDHTGDAIIYGDTDSVASDSLIRTSNGDVTVETLFLQGDRFWSDGEKEYSANDKITILHSTEDGQSSNVGYNYVYRHKVSKARYKITTVNGKEVVVTEDHSVMVLVNGKLVEKKPIDIHEGDVVITVV